KEYFSRSGATAQRKRQSVAPLRRCVRNISSTDLAPTFDAPHLFNALASHAIDLVVHVHRCANVIGNDAEPIADPVAPLRMLNVQMPMLLGKTFHLRCPILFYDPKATSVAALKMIV